MKNQRTMNWHPKQIKREKTTMEGRPDLPARFFKVILPSTTVQKKLRLPNNFVEKYKHELSNVVKLTDRAGGIWRVRLGAEEEMLWLQRGWDKFYEDHSIEYGYFLIFKYTGNSSFKVLVFDMTATEVHYPAHNTRNSKETQEEGDDDSLTILDSLPHKLVACPLRSPSPLRSFLAARHDKNQSSCGTKRGKKAVYAAGTSSLTNPSFTVEMKANLTPQWVVYVPARFAMDHLPKSPKYMELHDSDGKKWRVRVNLRPNCNTVRALSTGWADFAKAKEIKVGDTCVFEVIPGNKPALKVSIYHNTGRVPRRL